MSASGDFTPPEFPSGITQDPNDGPPGVSPGVALAILAGVLALGIVAVFTIGQTKSGGAKLVARPTVAATLPGFTPSAAPSAAASTPSASASTDPATGTTSSAPTGDGSASDDPDGSSATSVYTSEFYVGECVNTNGSGTDFSVSAAGCSNADYKIIYAYQNETGNIDNDMSQCYTVNGNDNEFENGDAAGGYTLYCMNSLIGDYSPRRANVDNCLDSAATYEVDCSNSQATWIVIGRLNGTTDTKGCSQFGSYDNSYYWPSAPSFVLCVDKYKH